MSMVAVVTGLVITALLQATVLLGVDDVIVLATIAPTRIVGVTVGVELEAYHVVHPGRGVLVALKVEGIALLCMAAAVILAVAVRAATTIVVVVEVSCLEVMVSCSLMPSQSHSPRSRGRLYSSYSCSRSPMCWGRSVSWTPSRRTQMQGLLFSSFNILCVTGWVKTRVRMVSETQLNIEGIVQLETLASEHNTGLGNSRK